MVRAIVGLWRWRGNPLCRRTDRHEAWLALAALCLSVLVAPIVGLVGAGSIESALASVARQQRAERQPTWAVVEQSALYRPRIGDPEAVAPPPARYRVRAHWYAPSGALRQGTVILRRSLHPGERFRLWTDADGRRTTPPMPPHTASAQAAIGGLGLAGAAMAVVEAARRCGVRLLLRRRYAAWAAEWQRIGPDWGRADTGN